MNGQIITVALILLGHTFLTPAVQAIEFDYYNDHGVMSYGKGYWGDKKIIAQFPEMNRADLRLVKNISGERELVEGYIPTDEISIKNEEYHWVTDGHVILWRGKIVSNPPGTPTVDIASFQAMGRFAVDKYSLYFDGQRTESNSGASRVDLATLKAIEGNSTTLVDSKNLYLSGRRQGSSSNVTVLEKRWWGINPRLMSVNRNLYSNDLLIRSGQNIYLNGVHLTANADSFEIIRWIPHSLLVFRDNKGMHRYPFGQLSGKAIPVDDDVSFEVGESRVRWRKQLTPDRQWSKWIDLPGIEPEQFHLITGNIAQYKDRLYVTKLSTFGEDQLEIIPLDTPDLVIDRSFNSGKQHAYFIRQLRSKSVQIIPVNGPLTKNDRFAYDDRNVYTWTDTEVRITPSPCPAKTRVREENVRELHNRDIIIPLTDESCRNAAAEVQTLKP
ncbi:TPA: DKNYY family protein [Escherichia coli]|uniref:hypothetical protein n=1 Tax=Escherichia coli TaxID=562 RepID=UPI0005AB6B67|nr:hypothetical protein [Escherichia coli]AXO82628.1 DKNYY family protein [Escherichia coli]EFG2674848.1 DKNYY family protein [Escherichia coli]EFM6016900.1 DKNYY family protein [Escherichia coli]EIT3899330.1 DKNYY family protein [Escherichia coli]EMB3659305.1 DKNYY family protein [Escherichia coli]